mmetsp:Transcript_28427/g.45762  ORF Transcript_28427/g.45762 Transcript_28427/m.45762 type:complete len:299 (+) Transcript_28427:484-1380(+)
MELSSVKYRVDGRVAYITLNRPERLNAIGRTMPQEIRMAVEEANRDDNVHCIVLSGEGRAFCAGYDLQEYAEIKGHKTTQKMPWDPTVDYKMMMGNTEDFMSLQKSPGKPTIAKVHGYAVAGGSDIALCCDLVVIAEDAKIGYPPARVWGIPTTAMWAFRVGPEMAKRLLFTGKLINGKEAQRIGLVSEAVPANLLDKTVDDLARNIAAVPKNQLLMSKLVVNQTMETQGLRNAQLLSTLFDGIARHSPEGMWFKKRSEEVGFQRAVKERDSGEPIAPNTSHKSFDRKTRTVFQSSKI